MQDTLLLKYLSVLDMEQFLTGMLPSDEFYNRMILKTEGNKEIINDKYGLSIDYNDLSLIDFTIKLGPLPIYVIAPKNTAPIDIAER